MQIRTTYLVKITWNTGNTTYTGSEMSYPEAQLHYRAAMQLTTMSKVEIFKQVTTSKVVKVGKA